MPIALTKDDWFNIVPKRYHANTAVHHKKLIILLCGNIAEDATKTRMRKGKFAQQSNISGYGIDTWIKGPYRMIEQLAYNNESSSI